MAELEPRSRRGHRLLQVLLLPLLLHFFQGINFCAGGSAQQSRFRPRTLRSTAAVQRAALPILGDTLQLLNGKTMSSYQVDGRRKFGNVWKTSVLFKKAVIITGAAELAEAMKQESRPNATKAFFPPHHQRLFGTESLLMQSGPPHRKLRRLVQAAMIPKAVSSYLESINEGVSELLAKCKSQNGPFSMVEMLRTAVVTTMLKILFGRQASASEIESLIEDVSTWSDGLLSAPLTFLPWSNAARAMRARARVAKIIRGWLQSCGDGDGTLLSRLVYTEDEDGARLTEEEIVDNVFTLVFAATDTTASSLSSSFLALSRHPDLQQQLREVCSEEDVETVDRNLDAFLSEVLRTSPPAPFAMRLVEEDLEVSKVPVPAGWLMVYGFAGTMLCDAERYPQPEEFLWNRTFSDGQGQSLDEAAFGGGPRMCPGRFLAAQVAKTVLREVLGPSGFRWELEPRQDLSQRYTPGLFPVDGLKVVLKK